MPRTLAGGNSGHPEEEGYLARGVMGDAHLLLGAVPEGKQEEGAMGPLLGAFSLGPPVLAQAGTPESVSLRWASPPCSFPWPCSFGGIDPTLIPPQVRATPTSQVSTTAEHFGCRGRK